HIYARSPTTLFRAPMRLRVDRVAVVLRVFAVDRDERHAAHVLAIALRARHDVRRQPPRRFDDRLGPLVRYAVREDRDVGLDTGLIEAADDLDDAADREAALRRVLDDLDLHEIARTRAAASAAGDQHLRPALAFLG